MFFDRLAHHDVKHDADHISSIVQNINNILNTKKDYGCILEGYGIRDLNEYSTRDQLTNAVMDEVKRNIEAFEPRVDVTNIEIENAADPFRIAFRVECKVKDTRESLLMEFNSVSKKLNLSDD